MAVLMCARSDCDRLLSVSRIPGGNPVARQDPENFAVVFWRCDDCHAHYCDRCVKPRALRKPACGTCGNAVAKPDIDALLN